MSRKIRLKIRRKVKTKKRKRSNLKEAKWQFDYMMGLREDA